MGGDFEGIEFGIGIETDHNDDLVMGYIHEHNTYKLDPITEGEIIKEIIDKTGYTQKKISELTGIHVTKISRYLNATKLPEELKKGILDGKISLQNAIIKNNLLTKNTREKKCTVSFSSMHFLIKALKIKTDKTNIPKIKLSEKPTKKELESLVELRAKEIFFKLNKAKK